MSVSPKERLLAQFEQVAAWLTTDAPELLEDKNPLWTKENGFSMTIEFSLSSFPQISTKRDRWLIIDKHPAEQESE